MVYFANKFANQPTYPSDLSMAEINQTWFKQRLQSQKMSQRKLATLIGIDPASMSYMLRGQRKMSMEDATQIAKHLSLSVTEVMRQAGIDVIDDITKVPIKGSLNDQRMVFFFPKGTYDYVIAPPDLCAKSFALQLRSPSNVQDGWLYFVSGQQEDPSDCLDRFCYVALSDGRAIVAILKRGYKMDRYNLITMQDGGILENKAVSSVHQVKWIMPT
jgi:transcriptional regulator with XRE-family HTH domain